MKIAFTKMQGAGNDFVVVDATQRPLQLNIAQRQQLADRRFGIGCDQLLVIEPAQGNEDFRYRIFNADGGEVEQCGNGVRCVAQYIHDHRLSDKQVLQLASLGGVLHTELVGGGEVRVNMGEPVFAPARVPFDAGAEAVTYPVELEGETLDVGVLSMGNPHAVVQVSDLDATPVSDLGEMLERHSRFPNRVNVGFMQRIDAGHIRLRVFERGVGETLACGTGACAAAVWGMLSGQLNNEVSVKLPGGTLVVSWRGRGNPVFLGGPATTVFAGNIEI